MIRLPVALAIALFASAAAAHSSLPSADWCSHGRIDIAGTFSYDGDQLYSALTVFYCPDAPRNCGEFDHAYERAMIYANTTCAAFQGNFVHGEAGQVIPFAVSPLTYLVDNHHVSYDVGDGLYGYCLRCTDAPANLPVGPRDPRAGR